MTQKPTTIPFMEFPSVEDTFKACQMVDASRPSGIYTDEERGQVMKIAKTIMMKRLGRTIQ